MGLQRSFQAVHQFFTRGIGSAAARQQRAVVGHGLVRAGHLGQRACHFADHGVKACGLLRGPGVGQAAQARVVVQRCGQGLQQASFRQPAVGALVQAHGGGSGVGRRAGVRAWRQRPIHQQHHGAAQACQPSRARCTRRRQHQHRSHLFTQRRQRVGGAATPWRPPGCGCGCFDGRGRAVRQGGGRRQQLQFVVLVAAQHRQRSTVWWPRAQRRAEQGQRWRIGGRHPQQAQNTRPARAHQRVQAFKVGRVQRQRKTPHLGRCTAAGPQRQQAARHDDSQRQCGSVKVDPRCRGGAGVGPRGQAQRHDVGHGDAGQRAGRCQQPGKRLLHRGGVKERALPAGAVVQHQAAQVQPRHQAQRQGRRGAVQHQRGALRHQRCGVLGPQRASRRGRTAAAGPTQAQAGQPRTNTAKASGRQRQQHHHVDRQVPGHHGPHGGRQQIHLLRRAQLIGQHTGGQAQQHRQHHPGRVPAAARQPALGGAVSRQQALQGNDRAGDDKTFGAGVFTHGGDGLSGGPQAVFSRPKPGGGPPRQGRSARGVLHGLQQQHLARFVFGHPGRM